MIFFIHHLFIKVSYFALPNNFITILYSPTPYSIKSNLIIQWCSIVYNKLPSFFQNKNKKIISGILIFINSKFSGDLFFNFSFAFLHFIFVSSFISLLNFLLGLNRIKADFLTNFYQSCNLSWNERNCMKHNIIHI